MTVDKVREIGSVSKFEVSEKELSIHDAVDHAFDQEDIMEMLTELGLDKYSPERVSAAAKRYRELYYNDVTLSDKLYELRMQAIQEC